MKKIFSKKYSFNVILNMVLVSLIPIGFVLATSTFEFYYFILNSSSQVDSSLTLQNIKWLFYTQFKILIISSLLSILISSFVAKKIVKPITQFTDLVSNINNQPFFEKDESNILLLEENSLIEINNLAKTINTLITTIFNYKKANDFFKKENVIDNLTKLYNKKYLLEKLSYLFSNENHNISLLFLDIDKFKHVNDTYGHFVGDEVLKETSKIIKSTVDACGFKKKWYSIKIWWRRNYCFIRRYR